MPGAGNRQIYPLNFQLEINVMTIPTPPAFKRIRKFAKRDHWLRHICLSVCTSRTTRHPLIHVHQNIIGIFFEKSVEKIQNPSLINTRPNY
jgi:hypothetical protein